MKFESLNAPILEDIYKKVWEDALSVKVTGVDSRYEPDKVEFLILYRMTHPLLPKKFLYSTIQISGEEFEKVQENTNHLVQLLDKKILLAIEDTRRYIKKEVDALAASRAILRTD